MTAPRKCRHPGAFVSYRTVQYPAMTDTPWMDCGHFQCRICDLCGEWLSLGPSNDTAPGVAVEIRAAALAATFRPDRRVNGRWEGRNHMEWLGASCHRQGFGTLDDAGCQAGWLAHAIVTHDTDHAGGGEGE